jgi:hypothetical protein
VLTITDTTPGIITALTADPRTSDDSDIAASTGALGDMAHAVRTTETGTKP